MHNTNKCKCGSRDVIYVVHKGRNKKVEMFCSNCLPVDLGLEPEEPDARPLTRNLKNVPGQI